MRVVEKTRSRFFLFYNMDGYIGELKEKGYVVIPGVLSDGSASGKSDGSASGVVKVSEVSNRFNDYRVWFNDSEFLKTFLNIVIKIQT